MGETLITHWVHRGAPAALFANVEQQHQYVIFEVVFLGSAAETVDMRDLRYSPAQVPAPAFRPDHLHDRVRLPANYHAHSTELSEMLRGLHVAECGSDVYYVSRDRSARNRPKWARRAIMFP